MRKFFSSARRVRGATHPLAALGLLLAPAGAAQAQTFAAAVTYNTGDVPQGIATVDVNGDGRLDIITVNSSSNNVGVLLGSAAAPGTFPATATFYGSGGSFPVALGVGDVNGDGRPDIVVDNANSNNVSVLLNSATAPGTFVVAVSYPSGAIGPRGLGLADLNGDGRLDVVVGGNSSNEIGVLLNLATAPGTFGPAATYPTNVATDAIAVGDVNGDGRPDVAVTGYFSANTITVLLNSATAPGTFPALVAYASGGTRPRGVTLGDVNGDGRPDIVAGNEGSDNVGVLLNSATTPGTFGTAAAYSSGAPGPDGVRIRDMNGDGRPDIVAANYNVSSGSTVSLLLNSATMLGTFGTGTTYSSGGQGPIAVALGDVNSDGLPDIATTNVISSTVGVLLNASVSAAPTLTSLSPTSGPVGTSVTLTGTGLSGATGVSFNGTAATTFSVVNATTITATVPTGATTGNVTVTTPGGGTSNGLLFTVTYPDLVITTTTTVPAGIYNSITVNSPGNATLAGAVTVNTSTTVNSGATLTDGCFVLSGAGSFTLAAGATLGICNTAGIAASGATGAIQNTGPRSFASGASYVYNGTASQVTGSGLPSQVRNLTSTNSNAVTLSGALAIRQVLALNAGDLNLNGQGLTLLSDASGTALIANLGAGQVRGATTVQRYLDPTLNPGLGYRHLSAPVFDATVAAFGSGGTTPVVNSAYNSAANPGTVTPFPTVYRYDQSRLASSPATTLSTFDKGWVSPASLSDAADLAFTGFTVQLLGASTLSFTGQVAGSSGSIPLRRATDATAADAGLNLVGNPYPSPLDLSTITAAQRTNMDAAFYVFESTSQYGGAYRSYVNGVASTGGSSLIGTAQAFFVRVTNGQASGSLALGNGNRLTTYGPQAPVRRTAADPRPLVRLALQGASGPADGFVAYAQAGATAGFDGEYDAAKLPNSTGLNLSSATPTDQLSIDGRAAFTAATVLALNVGVPAAGTYSLAAAELANLPAGLTATLRDAATGQLTPLAAGTSYRFNVSATEATALLTGRFTLQFSAATPLATAASLAASEVTVYPNPAQGRFTVQVPAVAGASQVQAELLNTLGQVVRRQSASLPAAGATLPVEAAGLAAGVYTLRLTAGASTLAKRVVLH